MTHRSKHLTYYTILIGLLLISFGANFILYNRILIYQDFIVGQNRWITPEQFIDIENEIKRLETEKYQIIPSNQTIK